MTHLDAQHANDESTYIYAFVTRVKGWVTNLSEALMSTESNFLIKTHPDIFIITH